MNYVAEYLGGVKYEKEILKVHPNDVGVKVFLNEFGDAIPLLKKLAVKKVPIIMAHGVWSHNNHRYGPAEFKKAVSEAKRYSKFAVQFPDIKFYYSPWCEPQENANTMQQVLNACKNVISPSITLINGGPTMLQNFDNEVHGGYFKHIPPSYRVHFGYDGLSQVNADITEQKAFAWQTFGLWIPECNGNKKDEYEPPDKPLPIPARDDYPEPKLIQSMLYQRNDKLLGTSLPHDWVYKSHAENTGQLRSNKPLFISPVHAKTLELKFNGKVVAIASYTKKYTDGRAIYRLGVYGFTLSVKYGLLEVWVNNKFYGKIDPAFRENAYKNHH